MFSENIRKNPVFGVFQQNLGGTAPLFHQK
jgi:hypothetical protein